MPLSMTGFMRADRALDSGVLAWEIASVNNRFLDVHVRTPECLRTTHPAFKNDIKRRLSRGKVEAKLFWHPAQSDVAPIIDAERLAGLVDLKTQLEHSLPDLVSPNWLDVLRWPQLTITPEQDEEALQEAATELLNEALEGLVLARAKEGEGLALGLNDKLTKLSGDLKIVRAALPNLQAARRDVMLARLEALDVEVDTSRFEQELVYVLQRIDVAEELDRLDVHVEQAQQILQSSDAVGRKLDFLMQEFNREVNTLASKIQEETITAICIEAKVLIEQMREQVQNIE